MRSGRSPQCRLVGSQRFGSLVVCQARLMMARRAALTAYECQAGGLAAQALMPWLPTSGQKFGHISVHDAHLKDISIGEEAIDVFHPAMMHCGIV
ncbi:unnamed protein product [Effrenium voratum]|nr:unnamed protein product [Effrenium voratum]